MVDISKVSQNVMKTIDDIASMDGKKGISSKEEKDALAELLSSGKIEGNNNIEYVKNEINRFDLKEASANASDFVKRAIAKAMEIAGDKKMIDDELELAVLDKIIDNASGEYSPEDVKYAKLLKAQTQYAGQKSSEATLREENSVLAEKNQELMQENANLKEQLAQMKEQAAKACQEIDNTLAKNNTMSDADKQNAIAVKTSIQGMDVLADEISSLIGDLEDKQAKVKDGKLPPKTFEKYQEEMESKIKAKKDQLNAKQASVRSAIQGMLNKFPEFAKNGSIHLAGFAKNVVDGARKSGVDSIFNQDTPAEKNRSVD